MPAVPPVVTQLSSSATHARNRVLDLYRTWLRAISQTKSPDIVALYSLDVPTSTVKSRIRFEFLKNIQEKDTRIVDRLLFQGRLEFEETMNQWKQKNHVMNYFDQAAPKQKSFMDDFYSQGN